ncbi:DUF309 domain-containing protein [Sulfurimonas sp. CS5]|jgi:hypothetical protein|uniref:DUF309 domain-containing protein n=1 Tax=Sulfurimonas sp. CS5 TaxID=3391145 RepID=UPI0039E94C1F
MLNKYLDEFIKCLDEQGYFEAHEILEEVWFPRRFENNNEIKLLKGFINAAVSFELEKKGRTDASKRVWKNYIKYRQLLYKVDSVYFNKYHFIVRYIDNIKSKIN